MSDGFRNSRCGLAKYKSSPSILTLLVMTNAFGTGRQTPIDVGVHESDKRTKEAISIETTTADTQNLKLATVSLNDSFRINTCNGRLIAQIKNVVIKAIKTNSITNSRKPNF